MPTDTRHLRAQRDGALLRQRFLKNFCVAGIRFEKRDDLLNFDQALGFDRELVKVRIAWIDWTLCTNLDIITAFHVTPPSVLIFQTIEAFLEYSSRDQILERFRLRYDIRPL